MRSKSTIRKGKALKRLCSFALTICMVFSFMMVFPVQVKAETDVVNYVGYAKAVVTLSGNLEINRGAWVRYASSIFGGDPYFDIYNSAHENTKLNAGMSVAIQPGIYSDVGCTSLIVGTSSLTGNGTVTVANTSGVTADVNNSAGTQVYGGKKVTRIRHKPFQKASQAGQQPHNSA